jgi:hypothetical protein
MAGFQDNAAVLARIAAPDFAVEQRAGLIGGASKRHRQQNLTPVSLETMYGLKWREWP